MTYKRASTLVGLPDQDRGWEEVQVRERDDDLGQGCCFNLAHFSSSFPVLTGKDVLQMVRVVAESSFRWKRG